MISRANWTNVTSFDGENAFAAANRYLPPFVSLLLVLLIGWQLARVVWMIMPGNAAGDVVVAPANLPQQATASESSTNVQAIAATHIFGIADAETEQAVPVEEPDQDLADTRLVNLELNGTVSSAQPEFSVAVISDNGSNQKVYAIGDSVGSNASLHAVYADRVVLNENGALTNLKLPREFKNNPSTNVRRTSSLNRQTSQNANSIQNVVSQNMTRLTEVIRPVQYTEQGQPAGFRVYPGRDRQQFAKLGLRPGDIIKDIDGQSLADPTQAMQIFQSLGTAEEVAVTVVRNGQAEQLVLKTSQLELSDETTK